MDFELEAKLSRPDMEDLATTDTASISDLKPLASYNWIERPTPTIAVPGCPALWTPLSRPTKLDPDSGRVFVAQNAARHPTSPLEPLFRAVYATDPSFDPKAVDIFCDRNNIRKLLNFANGETQFTRKPFDIWVERVGNSLILCRAGEATTQFIKKGEFVGFGHEFEKNYTTEQIKDSTGHHRIVNYKFCDLNLVIRSETDGFVSTPPKATNSSQQGGNREDELTNIMGSLSLNATKETKETKPDGSLLTIQQTGRSVPLDSTLEIKTRTAKKPIDVQDVAAQLWVSQTPKLVRAYHMGGRFTKTEVKDVKDEVKKWEEDKSQDLKRLGALMRWIIDTAKAGEERHYRIHYNAQADLLLFYKRVPGMMLPDELYAKWGDNSEAEKRKQDKVIIAQNAPIIFDR